MPSRRNEGYGPDLVRVHHEHFGDVARNAAATVLEELRRRHGDGGLVVDLGCGTGILARALTVAGYDVLGVDISPDMLRLATQHAPLATFVRASLVEVELPSCAAVTAIGECVNYLFDERNTAGALGQLIGRVHHALLPGGVFVLDVAGPGRAGPGRVTEMFHDHDGWAMRVRVEEGADGVLTRDMTLFCAAGDVDGHFRRIDERHGLRLYRPADVTRALRDAGFRVRRLRGYGDLRFGPGWAGFIATKS